MNIFVFFILVGFTTKSETYKIRKDLLELMKFCTELCHNCRGKPKLQMDTCVCEIETSVYQQIEECLSAAKKRANWLDIEWSLKFVDNRDQKLSYNREDHVKKEVKRSLIFPKRQEVLDASNFYQPPPSRDVDLSAWPHTKSNYFAPKNHFFDNSNCLRDRNASKSEIK